MAKRPSVAAAAHRIVCGMIERTPSETRPRPNDGARAISALLHVLEAIEGVRLDSWENIGLTLQQCRVLHVIEHEMDAPVQTDLAKRLGVRPATVTLQLNKLKRQGLIERIRDRDDRRVRHVVLTEMGRQVLGSILSPPHGDIARALARYRREEVDAALTMIDQLERWVTQRAESPAAPQQLHAVASG
jgi:DNA-binding MarR family transcriptional regulator